MTAPFPGAHEGWGVERTPATPQPGRFAWSGVALLAALSRLSAASPARVLAPERQQQGGSRPRDSGLREDCRENRRSVEGHAERPDSLARFKPANPIGAGFEPGRRFSLDA